jgi:hypothetical protein
LKKVFIQDFKNKYKKNWILKERQSESERDKMIKMIFLFYLYFKKLETNKKTQTKKEIIWPSGLFV